MMPHSRMSIWCTVRTSVSLISIVGAREKRRGDGASRAAAGRGVWAESRDRSRGSVCPAGHFAGRQLPKLHLMVVR
jgi:hypothetical protein